jgi:hypothetical protein
MHTIEMVQRGVLKDDMYQPPSIIIPIIHNENGVPRDVDDLGYDSSLCEAPIVGELFNDGLFVMGEEEENNEN